jgi:hypothetical protein
MGTLIKHLLFMFFLYFTEQNPTLGMFIAVDQWKEGCTGSMISTPFKNLLTIHMEIYGEIVATVWE